MPIWAIIQIYLRQSFIDKCLKGLMELYSLVFSPTFVSYCRIFTSTCFISLSLVGFVYLTFCSFSPD